MFLSGHLYSPNNTGMPDYNICGQASSVLSFANISFKLGISKDGSVETTLINLSDLSTPGVIAPSTITYGNYDIYFGGFNGANVDPLAGAFKVELDVYETGTTNRVTWEKFNVSLQVAKAGYQSFVNSFEFYNYDVGNEPSFTMSGNKDFDIYLVENANNLDINGNQTKAFSSLVALRRPFTNEVYFYNMVGTQGSIAYYKGLIGIGNGAKGVICNEDTLIITEKISLPNGETCSADLNVNSQQWVPTLNTSNSCPASCGDCVNDLAQVTINYYLDFTNVSPVNINGEITFVTQYLIDAINIDVYDCDGNTIQSFTDSINPDYATWFASPAFYLIPIQQNFIPSAIGDNVIKVCNKYTAGLDAPPIGAPPVDDTFFDIYTCCQTMTLPTCHWWTVSKGDLDCGQYIFNNCSASPVTIEVQQLQDDGSFITISTNLVGAFSDLPIEFQTDGVYVIKVPDGVNPDDSPAYKYYTLPVFCAIQSCFLNMINAVICKQPNGKCTEDDFYNFNSFIINFHSFMMVLNSEMNFNYLYTTLTDDKIKELGTINDYIKRLAEYCTPIDSKCLPCANASA